MVPRSAKCHFWTETHVEFHRFGQGSLLRTADPVSQWVKGRYCLGTRPRVAEIIEDFPTKPGVSYARPVLMEPFDTE